MEEPNLNYIKDLAGDDLVFQNQFIDIIRTELPLEVMQYNDNINNHRLREASEDVHKIKHKINILGLNDSYKVAHGHEEELRDGNAGKQSDFITILVVMQKFINTI